MPFSRELEVARAVAVRSAELALRHQAAGLKPEAKADDSPVTIADRECERLIAGVLTEAFQDDGILGEEGAKKESRNGRRWILDPIDGTRDFVRGNPFWAVLIGLEVESEVVAGIAYLPMLGKMFHAARGAGAYRNDTRIHVSAIDRPGDAVLCVNGLNRAGAQIYAAKLVEWMSQFWAVRSLGGALDCMMVASGEAEIWIESKAAAWDLAPLQIIVEESGGRFFNFDGGNSIYGGNGVACVPGLENVAKDFVLDLPAGYGSQEVKKASQGLRP